MDNIGFLRHMATAECGCDPDVGLVPCEVCQMGLAAKELEDVKKKLSWMHEVMNFISRYEIDDIMWTESLNFFVNCNDVFYWGTADAEDLTPETIPVLYDAFNEVNALCEKTDIDHESAAYHEYGAYLHNGIACLLYCAKIRKMRPQDAFYQGKYIPEWSWCLFDECGPERKRDFFNPGPIGEKKEEDNETD